MIFRFLGLASELSRRTAAILDRAGLLDQLFPMIELSYEAPERLLWQRLRPAALGHRHKFANVRFLHCDRQQWGEAVWKHYRQSRRHAPLGFRARQSCLNPRAYARMKAIKVCVPKI